MLLGTVASVIAVALLPSTAPPAAIAPSNGRATRRAALAPLVALPLSSVPAIASAETIVCGPGDTECALKRRAAASENIKENLSLIHI